MGIEPTLAAWEAAVLPLNYARANGDSKVPGGRYNSRIASHQPAQGEISAGCSGPHMQTHRARRLALLTFSLFAAAALIRPAWANDPTPASGTLAPDSPTVTFTAGPFPLTNESYAAL